MARPIALALLLAALAAPVAPNSVWAQVAGPTPGEIVAQQQANLNRFQLQLQANQLQQLQRQNAAALQQPDPTVQAEAMARRRQIQQQMDRNTALQQQTLWPQSNPTDVGARLQQYEAEIESLRRQAIPIPAAPIP